MAAEKDKMQYLVEVVDKATSDLQKIESQVRSLDGQMDKLSKTTEQGGMSFGKMAAAFGAGSLLGSALSKAINFLTNEFRSSITQATILDMSMKGLNTTAAAYGISQDAARESAKKLASDGMITVATAAKGLQSLFASGMNLEQATNLMVAYKDQAAFGRVNTLSMDQAVGNLAESFMTESSMIGNLSGQTENYNLIISRGAAIMGRTTASLSESERTQAKYLGTMQLGKIVAGDNERAMDSLNGAQTRLTNSINILHQNVGLALTPALSMLMSNFNDLVTETNNGVNPSLNQLAKTVAVVAAIIEDAISVVFRFGQAALSTFKAVGSGVRDIFDPTYNPGDIMSKWGEESRAAFGGLSDDIKRNGDSLQKTLDKIDKEGAGAFGNISKTMAEKIPEAVDKGAEATKKKLADLARTISSTIRDFTHSVELKTADFQRSLEDLVISHRDAIKDLRDQINQLNQDFNEGADERLATHEDNKNKILQKYEDETKVLKDNLNRRLADNTGSDEQLIAYFQAQIAEKEKARDEDLKNEDDRYTSEEDKQKKSLNKQIATLQEKLNNELDIQKAHQADFDAVKDKAADDDITRLKNSFTLEMEEMKRQHDIRMEELKREQDEILAVKSATNSSDTSNIVNNSKKVTPQTNTGYSYSPFVSSSRMTDPYLRDASGNPIGSRSTFHGGGMVEGNGEVPILAKAGEVVMTQNQIQGLLAILERGKINNQGDTGMIVNQTNHIYEQTDMTAAIRELGWMLKV